MPARKSPLKYKRVAVPRMSQIIDDAHSMVNEARAERGLPPWDFTKPRTTRTSKSQQLRVISSLDGLRGDLARTRMKRGLGLLAVAREIGAGVKYWHLVDIELGRREATREEAAAIHFWLSLQCDL